MSGFNPKNPTKYRGTDQFLTPHVTRNRPPTGSDYRQPETGRLYPISTIWQVGKDPISGTEGELWMLSKIVANVGYWIEINPIPPIVPTSFVTDSGTVIPTANVVNVNAGSSSINKDNGIFVIANPNLSNNMVVELTNRIKGDVTTSNATPTTIITFALGSTPGVYTFSGDITAFDSTDVAGASYGLISGIRTTGASAIEIGTQFNTNFEEAALITADVDVTVSGNNVVFTVTGVAGKTIDWDGLFNYRFVG
jgi:hypothetical protein